VCFGYTKKRGDVLGEEELPVMQRGRIGPCGENVLGGEELPVMQRGEIGPCGENVLGGEELPVIQKGRICPCRKESGVAQKKKKLSWRERNDA
jgi:hypothetical protein